MVVTLDLEPNTLNLKSMGRWVTGYIEPSSPYLPEDIEVPTILLNGLVRVDTQGPTAIGDHDGDGAPDLAVKFNRTAVQLILPQGDKVPVTVTGRMGSHSFLGTDSIRVKSASVTAPQAGEVVDPRTPYTVRWSTPQGVNVQWVGMLHSLDRGATWVLDATRLPNTGSALWDPPDVVVDSAKVAVVLVEEVASGDSLVAGVLGASDFFRIATPTAVEPLPVGLEFSPIWSSPATSMARMRYGLPRRSRVDLELFDIHGRRVRTLVAGEVAPGRHEVIWDGRTAEGGLAIPGLYFARMRAEGRTFQQRVVWLR